MHEISQDRFGFSRQWTISIKVEYSFQKNNKHFIRLCKSVLFDKKNSIGFNARLRNKLNISFQRRTAVTTISFAAILYSLRCKMTGILRCKICCVNLF